MPKLHFRQPGFTYSPCGRFTKHWEWIQQFIETRNLKHLYRYELQKSCFAHDAAYSDTKGLARTTVWDKILKERAYDIARNPKYHGNQRVLANMLNKFFDKKRISSECKWKISWTITLTCSLKNKKKRFYLRLKDHILAVDLAKMR